MHGEIEFPHLSCLIICFPAVTFKNPHSKAICEISNRSIQQQVYIGLFIMLQVCIVHGYLYFLIGCPHPATWYSQWKPAIQRQVYRPVLQVSIAQSLVLSCIIGCPHQATWCSHSGTTAIQLSANQRQVYTVYMYNVIYIQSVYYYIIITSILGGHFKRRC